MPRQKKIKILLRGYYGFKNSGDDVLLNAAIHGLKREFPEAVFTVLAKERVRVLENAEVKFVRPTRWLTPLRILRNDWLVFGGGGIFQDYLETHNLTRKLFLVQIAKALGKKILFIGISIGPLNTDYGRAMTKKVLEHADFISVRDQESYRWLEEHQIRAPYQQTFDMAILLKHLVAGFSRNINEPVLGLSFLALSSHEKKENIDGALLDAVSGAINELMDEKKNLKTKIFVIHDGKTNQSGDRDISQELYGRLRDKERVFFEEYSSDPAKVIAGIASCSAFFGMRLHANILSYLAGCPFLLANYHSKCQGFADTIGLPAAAVVDRRELLASDGKIFKEKIKRLLESPEELAPARKLQDCYENVSSHFKKIRAHVGLGRKTLS